MLTSYSKLVRAASPTAPSNWAALSVHGFEISIISWNNRAHSSLVGGENFYTVAGTFGILEADKNPDEMDTSTMEEAMNTRAARFLCFEFVGSQDEHS